MTKTPDLHTHSTASDGTLTPEALVQRAASAGVEQMALTDHDTLAGLDAAHAAAQRTGLQLISGVEISVSWSTRTIHVVGLDVDPDCTALQQGLASLREFRQWRAEEIGRRLEKQGISGAYEGARALAQGGLVGRTHFARFLVNRGHAEDVRDVFKRFLVTGKPGHVSGRWASLEEAIGWIRAAGGIAVIAHPARYGLTRTKMKQLIGDFMQAGGRGIEVVSGSHSRDEYFVFARHAAENGLLASAGSDYHGPEQPWVELGRLPPLPDGCRPVWNQPRFGQNGLGLTA